MAYDVFDIASYIINYCCERNIKISNLKLQKLLYFTQTLFLISNRQVCFDAVIEAWDYGPVVPEVYRKYKMYGSMSIPEENDYVNSIDEEDQDKINGMLSKMANMDAFDLVRITHKQDPWIESYNRVDRTITPEQIERFFN